MQSAELILGLLIAVAALVTIARRLDIAYPIFLVIGGLLLGLAPGIPRIEIEPDLIFLVVLLNERALRPKRIASSSSTARSSEPSSTRNARRSCAFAPWARSTTKFSGTWSASSISKSGEWTPDQPASRASPSR